MEFFLQAMVCTQPKGPFTYNTTVISNFWITKCGDYKHL